MPFFQKLFLKKTTALILAVCLIGLSVGPVLLSPRKAQATCSVNITQESSTTGQFTLETAWEALQAVFRGKNILENMMQTATLLWDKAKQLIKWALGVLLDMLLHQILAMLTNDIVNWIKNGETPRFLSMGLDDWLWMGVDNAGGAFIDQYLGAGWLCEPFDMDIKIALLEAPTFQEEVRCSLTDMVDNIDDFYDDFSRGGWKGWLELSKPQNNFYGAYLLAQDKKTSVEQIAQRELEKDMEMGEGYLSPKDCVWYYIDGEKKTYIDVETEDSGRKYTTGYRDVWGIPSLPEKCRPADPPDYNNPGMTMGGFQGPCDYKCDILTPASSVKQIADKGITNFYEQINAQISAATAKAGPYAVYVQAIATALVSRVIKEGFLWVTEEEVPEGGLGAAEDIEEIEDPATALQEQAAAKSVISQLEILKDNLNTLLTEQRTSLALLKVIRGVYRDTVAMLEDALDDPDCLLTEYEAGLIQDRIDHINDNIIASLNSRIKQLENDISKTTSLINKVNTAISLTNNFVIKVDVYLLAWEAAGGVASDPDLIAAKDAMNKAYEEAVKSIQIVLTAINGSTHSNNFAGLNGEITMAISRIVQDAINIATQRGHAEYPEPGTLYAELEAAQKYKDDIQKDLTHYCLP